MKNKIKPYKKGDIIHFVSTGVHYIAEVEDMVWVDLKRIGFNGWSVQASRYVWSLKRKPRPLEVLIELGDDHRFATQEEVDILNKIYANQTEEAIP